MLSKEIAEEVGYLLHQIESATPLISALAQLADIERSIDVHLLALATGGDLNALATHVHKHFAAARRVLPQIPPKALFDSITKLDQVFQNFIHHSAAGEVALAECHAHLEEFSKRFETFLTDQSGPNAVPLLRLSTLLQAEIETTSKSLALIVHQLSDLPPLEDEEESLSIYFPGEQSLDEIAEKLNALSEIFRITTQLAGTGDRSTVRIRRLEYGSFFADFALVKPVARVAREWIEAVGLYIYRNHTDEGRLAAGTGAAKAALKSAIDIRQLLAKSGIETTAMDVELERAGVEMARSVASLIGKQARFKVGETYVEPARVEPRLEYVQRAQLPPPSETE
jgi:hypothetical protein